MPKRGRRARQEAAYLLQQPLHSLKLQQRIYPSRRLRQAQQRQRGWSQASLSVLLSGFAAGLQRHTLPQPALMADPGCAGRLAGCPDAAECAAQAHVLLTSGCEQAAQQLVLTPPQQRLWRCAPRPLDQDLRAGIICKVTKDISMQARCLRLTWGQAATERQEGKRATALCSLMCGVKEGAPVCR